MASLFLCVKLLTQSLPVKAWTAGNALAKSVPILSAIRWMFMSLHLFPVPVSIKNGWWIECAYDTNITRTSVSVIWFERLLRRGGGLRNQGISKAKRITIQRDGQIRPTNTIILTFESHVPPKQIKAGHLNVKVDLYIPQPTQCFKCQRFGHHRQNCNINNTCPRCGEEGHIETREIQCQKNPKCVNCGENHSAYSKDCRSSSINGIC